jgi:hypothetical protein
MILLALIGGLLLALAILAREYQLSRERVARTTALEHMRINAEATAKQLSRAREDLYVLRVMMHTRGLITEEDFARSRTRLIETPRKRAQERSQIMRTHEVDTLSLVVDEGESIH